MLQLIHSGSEQFTADDIQPLREAAREKREEIARLARQALLYPAKKAEAQNSIRRLATVAAAFDRLIAIREGKRRQ